MTADELIRSGLLEAYVLGQASAEEIALIERMRASEPAVAAELDAIELAMEQQAMEAAVAPSPRVKEKVMSAIRAPQPPKSVPVVPIQRERKPFNWLAAASVAALVLSAGMNWMQYRELKNMRAELTDLEYERGLIAEQLQVQQASLEQSQKQLAIVMDPNVRNVVLSGMGVAEGSRARVYWDQKASLVHFDVLSLPPAPEGKQYQLWALVDGKPVDAGMVPLDSLSGGLARMKDIPNAQAFAVTIEKIGGNPTPTLEEMVLLGTI